MRDQSFDVLKFLNLSSFQVLQSDFYLLTLSGQSQNVARDQFFVSHQQSLKAGRSTGVPSVKTNGTPAEIAFKCGVQLELRQSVGLIEPVGDGLETGLWLR